MIYRVFECFLTSVKALSIVWDMRQIFLNPDTCTCPSFVLGLATQDRALGLVAQRKCVFRVLIVFPDHVLSFYCKYV